MAPRTQVRDNGTDAEETLAPVCTLSLEITRFLRENLAGQSLPAGHPQFAQWSANVQFVLGVLDAQLANHEG